MDVLSPIVVPNSPYSLCGRKAILKKERMTAGAMQQASAAPSRGTVLRGSCRNLCKRLALIFAWLTTVSIYVHQAVLYLKEHCQLASWQQKYHSASYPVLLFFKGSATPHQSLQGERPSRSHLTVAIRNFRNVSQNDKCQACKAQSRIRIRILIHRKNIFSPYSTVHTKTRK